jgi:acyl-CoA synthetase (AMP-forming)/AMP-acid ligase II
MSRRSVLSEQIPSVDERRRTIERTPLPVNIGALIDAASADVPDRQVWNFFESGETLTYRELHRAVNGLARSLLRAGIEHGVHVAVMLPNISAMPLTWLALARLGAVMVPVNMGYRPRELAYVLNDSQARYVVIHKDCLPVLQAAREDGGVAMPDERVIVAGGGGGVGTPALRWEDLASEPLDQFAPPRVPILDDLMNIQYTSGTTGFPKGCMLTHRYWLTSGAVNAFRDGRKYDRILASTPFYYMDPQWLLLMTLYQRATLFVAARQSLSRFMTWVREHRVNFCLLPWLAAKQPPNPLDARNEIVRANVYGVARQLHASLEDRFDLCAREAFGMTEIGSGLFMPIEATDMVGSGSCGVPSPFRECRIANENGETLPQGEVGELLIRGPGIMQGYYGKPEATAATFHGDWFRTGDLFRMDERGYFYIVGRLKDMIRRSGENIAAREVEAVLNAIPEVVEAAVVPVRDEVRGEEVKAFLRLRDGMRLDSALVGHIIAQCQQSLAPFKVPRYFTFRQLFPRTPSHKIAKNVLIAEAGKPGDCFDRVTGDWR